MHADTPGYVTNGIDLLDALIAEHIEGADALPRASNAGGSTFDCGTFVLRSYCWCDGVGRPFLDRGLTVPESRLADPHVVAEAERLGVTLVARNGFAHEDHSEGCPPNFEHFPSGFQASWYKHSHRGAECNAVLSVSEWASVLTECLASVAGLPAAYRVMITGSREWARELFNGHKLRADWSVMPSVQRDLMVTALRGARERAGGRHLVVVQGDASGADRLSGVLAERSPNCHPEAWPALWQRAPEGLFPLNVNGAAYGNLPPYYRDEALYMSTQRRSPGYDPRAGFARNEAMLASGVDEVLAFFADGAANKGTQGAVTSARRLGLPVTEFRA